MVDMLQLRLQLQLKASTQNGCDRRRKVDFDKINTTNGCMIRLENARKVTRFVMVPTWRSHVTMR
jgi:hypothetical protein